MAKQWKRLEAGPLIVETIFSVPDLRQPGEQRAARSRASSEAQRLLNLKHSRLRLELLLAANFTGRDLFLTLTFSENNLPHTREGVRRAVRAFFRELRKARRIRGKSVAYIYGIEHRHGEGRWHVHVVLNATGRIDLDDVVALWPCGNADVERLRAHFREGGRVSWDKLARYMCKERVDPGDVGRQGWTPSKGLTQPVMKSRRVSDRDSVTVPEGAEILERRQEEGPWGSFMFVKYTAPAVTD